MVTNNGEETVVEFGVEFLIILQFESERHAMSRFCIIDLWM